MLRVVLVEPHYAGNIGSVARIVKNFGAGELYLVNPLADHTSAEARMYAVDARDVLESARIVPSLREALDGCVLSFSTTARVNPKRVGRTVIRSDEAGPVLGKYMRAKETVAVVFGREPSGLTNEEVEQTDATITIPTSPEYPSLNLSHAVAVILYEAYKNATDAEDLPTFNTMQRLIDDFTHLAKITGRRRPDIVVSAFRAILARGVRTEKELGAIHGVIAGIREMVKDVDAGDTEGV